MLEELNIYKNKIEKTLSNKTYSKKTPLNTYTSSKILKDFPINSNNTYIEIHTLKKENKDSILLEFFEFIKIKDYKNYFDILFKLDNNKIETVLNVIDLYHPESITIYETTDNDDFEKTIKQEKSLEELYNYIIILDLEEQRIKIKYNKKNKIIKDSVKKIKKYFE